MKYLATITALTLVIGFGNIATGQNTETKRSSIGLQPMTPKTETAQTSQPRQQQTPAVQANTAARKMGFRLKEWKTIHTPSPESAQVTIATLQKLGCEVESDNHGNHIDVKYRCPEWKSMKLATDQLVNQWTTWCAAKGMETVVMNPPASTKKATVTFRLPATRTVHLHDPAQAKQIINTLNLVGCEVTSHQHGDHTDATFSCPDWVTIELPTDENAHTWQKWLDESGFETKHTH